MKRIEIIIPHERLDRTNNILEQFDVGGMSFYHISGRGKTKWKPIPVGRGFFIYDRIIFNCIILVILESVIREKK